MNEEIRAQVDARLKEKGLSRADLARATGIHPNAITRALNNTGGRGGNVPPVWQAILEALDLRLTVEARGEDRRGGEEKTARTPADLPDAGSPAGQTGEEKAPTSAGRAGPRRARKASTGEGG